jgi:anti-sigma B factor antagonist
MAFRFTIERPLSADSPCIVRLDGRLTLGPQLLDFGRRVAELLASRPGPCVLLDISAVEEVDSAGLGELVILYTTAGQNGSRLCLLSPTPRIAHLLETTRLSGILPHFADEAAAARWFGRP